MIRRIGIAVTLMFVSLLITVGFQVWLNSLPHPPDLKLKLN